MDHVKQSLIRWLAWGIDHGKVWGDASTDALMDAPMQRGPKRLRRLDPMLGEAMAKLAGQGQMARTGATSMQIAMRMRRWVAKKSTCKHGNVFIKTRQARYLTMVREAAMPAQKSPIISVAMDATRMGGRDTMYLALYMPALGVGFWCPPQARGGTRAKPKRHKSE